MWVIGFVTLGFICIFLGGFTLSPPLREQLRDVVRRLRNQQPKKPKDAAPLDLWKRDGQRVEPFEVSAAAPISQPPDPRRLGDAPNSARRTMASATGPQRASQATPETPQAEKPKGKQGNGGMSVDDAKRILQARGYSVKRRRRKPQAPTGA
jgi:hypothetical protein